MAIAAVLSATLPAARIAGGAILMGAGFCAGQYGVQRLIRKIEAPQPQTREQQTQALKVAVVNLAAANRKLEEVMKDPKILHALASIDRAVTPTPPIAAQAPLAEAA